MDEKSPKRVKKKKSDNKSIKFRCDYAPTPLKVLQARGWTQVHSPRDMRWDLWWCDTSDLKIALDGSTKLRPHQRVSHFRNHCELTRKNYLYRNLKRYRRLLIKAGKTREAELCDAMPMSFELPSEYRMLVEEHRRRHGTTWIVKPAGGSQRLKDLTDWRAKECVMPNLDNLDLDAAIPVCHQTYLVQKYIDDPYLLAGRKFDLRIYVLVTSFQPLKVWLAREGFARLSGEQFSLERIDDSRIHLTNMAIQLKGCNRRLVQCEPLGPSESEQQIGESREAAEGSENEDEEEEVVESEMPRIRHGRKWALSGLRQYLTARHGSTAVEELLQNIAVPQTINTTESKLPAEDNQISSNEIDQQTSTITKSKEAARKSVLKTPVKRLKTLRVGWLHKGPTDTKYSRMKRPLGGVKRLKLDESQTYPAHEIRRLAMEEFAGDSSKLEDRFDVSLGFFDGRAISDFKRPHDDRACDIWDYCEAHQTTPYQLNLFILTSSKLEEPAIGSCARRVSLLPKPDDVRLFYHYARVSKYSCEISYTECDKSTIHSYVMEALCGEAPPIEQFDPADYGHTISRIEKAGRVLLQINMSEDLEQSFSFPSAGDQAEAHSIVHEVQGWCDGKLGIGVVPNCGRECRPVFTWLRDGQLYKGGEHLYWLSDILEDGMKHAWSCTVWCKETGRELKSKVFEIEGDGVDRVDCD